MFLRFILRSNSRRSNGRNQARSKRTISCWLSRFEGVVRGASRLALFVRDVNMNPSTNENKGSKELVVRQAGYRCDSFATEGCSINDSFSSQRKRMDEAKHVSSFFVRSSEWIVDLFFLFRFLIWFRSYVLSNRIMPCPRNRIVLVDRTKKKDVLHGRDFEIRWIQDASLLLFHAYGIGCVCITWRSSMNWNVQRLSDTFDDDLFWIENEIPIKPRGCKSRKKMAWDFVLLPIQG